MNSPPWRRAVLGAAAVVVLLGIGGAIALHVLADPERLRKIAREKAQEAWSRDLAIGEIALVWLPLPAVHARDVTLGNAPGEKDPWSLHADRVVMGLALLPLLIGKARPRYLRIEGDIGRGGRKVKVIADLDDISGYGTPDAVAEGKIDLDWGKTRLTASGRIPLQVQLRRGAAFKAQLESQGLNDMLAFFEVERARKTAPARARLEVRNTGERIEVLNVDAMLGKLKVTGDARITTAAKTVIDVRMQADRLDWAQALVDSGNAPVPPLPPDQLFYDRPIAWPLLLALQDKQGTIDVRLGSLRLRNGVELQQVKADMAFEGDTLDVKAFNTNLLGGSAKGKMRFEGRKKLVRVDIQGTNVLLERWFKARGSDVNFRGGPMAITASLTGIGNSMRDLSKVVNGPVTIRMGPGVYVSQKAGDAEARMVAFSKKASTGGIAFECASAELPFTQGRAAGEGIVGARSDVSRLLTSGYVSLRDVNVDLRGRLLQKPGTGVGFSAIAKDVRISGNIHAMRMTLDPLGKPAAAVRAGVAVATLGLSVAGSAMANAAREDIDTCAAVFAGARK